MRGGYKNDLSITLNNLVGQQIKEIHNGPMVAGQKNIVLDVAGLSSGVYFVTIASLDRKVVQRFVVE